jgi:hypothetical protein
MKMNPMKRTMNLSPLTATLLAAGVISPPGHLFGEEKANPLQTALSATAISGYVDTAAIWKIGTGNGGKGVGNPQAGDTFPGRSYDGTGKQDGFNLNVVALTLRKPLDDSEWSAGYNFTLLFGPDAVNYNTSAGAGLSDFALKDAYVELKVPVGNGVNFRLGNFTEPIGYEVFESGSNPTYSRSYGYFIEPTQFTGVLASYQANEWFGACAGFANSWLPGLNARPTRAGAPAAESEKTYMGMVTLTAPKSLGFLSGATLNLGVIDGLAGGASDTTSLYVGGTTPTPLKNLSLGYAWEYRGTKQKNGASSTYANATSLYLLYQATEKLKFAGRAEYASGTQGTWYAVSPTETHPKNEVFGWTLTADYALWANVISRVEFRWDHDLANQQPFGVNDNNAFSLALNVIYKF